MPVRRLNQVPCQCGKYYEFILTRFIQCYYLPERFGSGQLTWEETLSLLERPLYPSQKMLGTDVRFLADCTGVSVEEFKSLIVRPPKYETDYPHSFLNELAPAARKLHRVLE